MGRVKKEKVSLVVNQIFQRFPECLRSFWIQSWFYFHFISYRFFLILFSFIISSIILDIGCLGFQWNYVEMKLPFWFFVCVFVTGYICASFILKKFLILGRYNIIFHVFFVLLGLNLTNLVIYVYGFQVSYSLYFLMSVLYLNFVTFFNFQGQKFLLLVWMFYSIFVFVSNLEIFLLFSNSIIYRVSRKRVRFRKKFLHILFPSIWSGRRLATLFYRQSGDTIFIWDYNLFWYTWVYISLSFFIFFVSSALYYRFVVRFSGVKNFFQFFSICVSIVFVAFVLYCLFVIRRFWDFSSVAPAFWDLYLLITYLGAEYDYRSYILFMGYGSIIYILSRTWIGILRRVVFLVVGKKYVVDVDYKTIRPIVYGTASFPLFWKFPRLWLYEILHESKKGFRRSVGPDLPNDAVYYYGGPNPHRVIFNPYTGNIIPIFNRDIRAEDYRVYYKLYRFIRRKPQVSLFSLYEKVWTRYWIEEESRKFTHSVPYSSAPYYYYTRLDLHSDYILNRLLVFEDVTRNNEDPAPTQEEETKNFFDSYLWESIWIKGFGRPMPSAIPTDSDLGNILNQSIKLPPMSSVSVGGSRDRYQDALMFRRRYLYRQQINIDRGIGLIPNEQYSFLKFFGNNFCAGIGDFGLGKIGVRNFVFYILNGLSTGSEDMYVPFNLDYKVFRLIRGLQTLYFRENYKSVFYRLGRSSLLWDIIRSQDGYSCEPKKDMIVYSVLAGFVYRALSNRLFDCYFRSVHFLACFQRYNCLYRYKFGLSRFLGNVYKELVMSFYSQFIRFGFSGYDLRPKIEYPGSLDTGVEGAGGFFSWSDNLLFSRFNLFNGPDNSLERVVSNFPPYSYLSKWRLEFSGFFERSVEFGQNPYVGRLGRFRFVNSRIILDNETSSKINYFFVNLNTWLHSKGDLQLQGSDFLCLAEDYVRKYNFISGELVYSRSMSDFFLIKNSFLASRRFGLRLFDPKFYKLILMGHESDLFDKSQPSFVPSIREQLWGFSQPRNVFDYSLRVGMTYGGFLRSHPILNNFTVSGLERAPGYMFSTTSTFYLNSFIFHSLYSTLLSSSSSIALFGDFKFHSLRVNRFRVPTFYPIFEQHFSHSLLGRELVNSTVLNGLRSSYLIRCNSAGFFWFSHRLNYRSFVNYAVLCGDIYPFGFFLEFLKRRVLLYGRVLKGSKTRDFVRSDFFLSLSKGGMERNSFPVCFHSRRWLYNWNIRLRWAIGNTARYEYYSELKHSRFYRSYMDRMDTHFFASYAVGPLVMRPMELFVDALIVNSFKADFNLFDLILCSINLFVVQW